MAEMEGGIGDMVNLPELDESTMVANLRTRFKANRPYTVCGQICVSVNPFRWLPLYEEELVLKFHAASDPFATLDPHVYAVAHAAHRRLTQAGAAEVQPSQSILVRCCGERDGGGGCTRRGRQDTRSPKLTPRAFRSRR